MKVCVFGASGTELDKIYFDETEKLCEVLATRGHSLMFGGGKNGMMGAAAKGFKECGGYITGVAPQFFIDAGVTYDSCDEFIVPDSMRDRKKYMEDNSDAFIATPGGIGTYEEFFEVLTLKQLAIQVKPIALFNVSGYFNKLYELMKDNVANGFIRKQTLDLFKVIDNIEDVVEYIENDRTDINKIKFN